MTAEQACALLGLFLRAHNDFTIRAEGNRSTFVEFERFYRGAAIAALPSYAEWLHAVWSLWRKGRGPEPFGLLRAVAARLGRALIARDYVNVRIRHWRPDETWDEVLYFFESFLLSLHGAVDAFARLLHVALGLPQGKRAAGFQHRSWRATLVDRGSSSALRDLLAPEAPFPAVVELVGVLRNFVHAEMLSEELLRDDDGMPEFMSYGKGVLVLHGASAERLKSAASQVGEGGSWGVSEGFDGVIEVMPIAFLREALVQTLAGIRAIMATQLLTGTITELAKPFDADFWISTLKDSHELLLLAGLSTDAVAPTSSPGG